MAMSCSLLAESQCMLGESPFWHASSQHIFWVDIAKGLLYSYDWRTYVTEVVSAGIYPSLLVEDRDENLLLSIQESVVRYNSATHNFTPVISLENSEVNRRSNDGGCDETGRLWISTMDIDCKPEEGFLYCINKDKTIEKKLSKLSIPNGLVWSADGTILYHIDSPERNVKTYAFDKENGTIIFERIAIDTSHVAGLPDGMAIDKEGMLWIAQWNGFAVHRWHPVTGLLLETVEVPVPHATACAFAGPDMNHLVITTACNGMSSNDLRAYPQSGNVFITKTNVTGLERHRCNL